MNILIMPCARKLRDGSRNPREYPYWSEVREILMSHGHDVSIIHDTIPYGELKSKLSQYDLVLTIDSFIQHFCWYYGIKCAVIWGPSDYRIFGHKENINIVHELYMPRPDQFNIWEGCKYDERLFPSPVKVVLGSILINQKTQE